jgi:hypothetical protein
MNMGNEIWRSKEQELVARYADRLAGMPTDLPREEPETDKPSRSKSAVPPAPPTALAPPRQGDKEITLNYANGVVPPKDLLNYKNMDLEMALWARAGVGWMSVIVLALMTAACFLLSTFLNLLPW